MRIIRDTVGNAPDLVIGSDTHPDKIASWLENVFAPLEQALVADGEDGEADRMARCREQVSDWATGGEWPSHGTLEYLGLELLDE